MILNSSGRLCMAALLVAVVCVASVGFAGDALARDKGEDAGIIFVADLRDASKAVDDAVLDLFSEIVRDGARRYATGYTLMDKENAQIILKDFGANLNDCLANGRDDCEVAFAERVQADIGVSGQILKMPDGSIRVVLKMFDVAKRSPMNSIIKSATSIGDLEKVLTDSVAELYKPLYRPTAEVGTFGSGKVEQGVPGGRGDKIVNPQTDQTGLLFIDTDPPNANIQLNGKTVGASPYQDQLMAGKYVIVAELNSYYHPARQEIQLSSEGATVNLILPPAFGKLAVTSMPSGAEVLIDDKPVGKTPYVDQRMKSGSYVVEVRRALYQSMKRTVTVKDALNTNESFDLVADYGSIKVVSDPVGASVMLDGADTGKVTPVLLPQQKTGMHVVTLDRTGYGRKVENVAVKNGQVADVSVKLDPKLGNLTVMTEGPDGKACRGTIVIDGEQKGATPWKGSLLAVEHQVKVECGGQAKTERVVVAHNENKVVKIAVENPNAGVVAADSAVGNDSKTGSQSKGTQTVAKPSDASSSAKDKYAKFDARRKRPSFQGRLSGGLDLNRATNGVAGLIQVGLGTGRWFDIHTGIGFPGYIWVTDFEVNLYPYGRFIPILAARMGLGFSPAYNDYSLDFTVGVEAWVVSWMAFYLKIGVGYTWNKTQDVNGVYVPGWLGVEFRY